MQTSLSYRVSVPFQFSVSTGDREYVRANPFIPMEHLNLHSQIGIAVEHASIVSCTDSSGIITYVNQNFCDISGYAAHELIGQKHSIMNSGSHPISFWQGMWQSISSGNIWRGDITNHTKAGKEISLDTIIYPIKNNSHAVTGYLSIRNDITASKKQASALQSQNQLLAKIAWMQSHDLRRPVSSILGLINLFEQRQFRQSATDQRKLIAHLKKMSNELDSRIHDIVRLTQEIDNVVNDTITKQFGESL